jgi:serine/threonine protein kinase
MIGTTLGHFRITAKLGEGGMGEVYRAEDTKLGREVALKVLPEAFAKDYERMGRFAREAQVLASLNHTNIAAIYGLEEDGDRRALVMELVEGETLLERIARGPLSIEESARIGLEMARAIEIAHEKGIVHRDLKPANVKITPEGQVKVLDFGLAKALEEETAPGDIAASPTLTAAATQAGIILGTAAYMSPEQAAGSATDRRSDIWSYGVVLSEMLTGRQQFGGETVSHTLASVLKDEPDWDHFPKRVPPRIVDLLKRCLRKDARQRLQAIGEARLVWEEYLAAPEAFEAPTRETVTTAPIPTWKKTLPWAVAAVLAAALGLMAMQLSKVTSRPRPLLRATILPPEKHDWYLNATYPGRIAISPDGGQLAFSAIAEEATKPLLWVRPLNSPVGRPLPNTEGAAYPFWSPDGRHVAFYAGGKLKKIAVSGGPPVSLCDAPYGKSGSWSDNGVIVFAPNANSGIHRVSASGGECVAITELDAEAGDNSHRHPVFLPDGNHFIYLARRSGSAGENMLRIRSLDGETDRDLLTTPTNAAYASGRLLFIREATLMAQPFDTGRLELRGEAVPLIEQVLGIGAAALGVFSVSETGELVYQSGEATQKSQLVWKDRTGVETGTLGDAADQSACHLSADGAAAATTIAGEDDRVNLWVYDASRGLRSRFTFNPGVDVAAVWSPTRDRIVFSSDREGGVFNIYIKEVGGTGDAQLLFANDSAKFPYSWTSDGKMILYSEINPAVGGGNLFALPIEGDREPIALIESEFFESHPTLSPDGRWLAYSSNESGRREVYVTTFPRPERKWQVSVGGGRQPRWTKDGAEIVYLGGNRDTLFAVEVDSIGDTFDVGAITKLFDVQLRGDLGADWGVTADGERFLINTAPERARISALHLVVNWPAILEER